MPRAVVIAAVRSPIGRYGGALAGERPDDLAGLVLRAAVERAGVDPAEIEDVVIGSVLDAGTAGMNIARNAALAAGLPYGVSGQTMDRQCA